MQYAELAARLTEASDAERADLLRRHSALADVKLAYELKEICYAAWADAPGRSVKAASALRHLALQNSDSEIAALADWVSGIADLVEGRLEPAITHLDKAQATFLTLNNDQQAAATQVAKLISLAMLGRYEEAIDCGVRAREVFLAHNDTLAAGKIEHNIGNLHFRRDRYALAAKFQQSARERFQEHEDQKQLATINNCLANSRALLHQFSEAEELYQEAKQQAEAANLPVTLAEIEGNLGTFALMQGRFDQALDYLERSRRRYAELGMVPASLSAEHEIADAYLELGLAPEAIEIYERIIPHFAELGMRADEARARSFAGRALIKLERASEAQGMLERARELYAAEGNVVGAAMADLSLAQLLYRAGSYANAAELARRVEMALAGSGSIKRHLLARWLHGEINRASQSANARELLTTTLSEAMQNSENGTAERCHTSLGLLALSEGDDSLASDHFQNAIAIIEELRAPLPGEEFRSAFLSDHLQPYHEMMRISLQAGRTDRALAFLEAARSRALADTLGGFLPTLIQPLDLFDADLVRQIEILRAELNYLYSQMNRRERATHGSDEHERGELRVATRKREQKLLALSRQLQHRAQAQAGRAEFNLELLQSHLGDETVLLEFAENEGNLIAFLVTGSSVEVFEGLGAESQIAEEIAQLRFQIDTLRFGAGSIRKHLAALEGRARQRLVYLYDLLLRKIERRLGERRLAIVPHRSLHYLPFHALHDGSSYLIERREVCYAPSAMVLVQCLQRPLRSFSNGLLVGVADEFIPRVRDEIAAVGAVLPESVQLIDDAASIEALRSNLPGRDLLHLACHAQFRFDNPFFSSVKLGDSWLTVREASALKVEAGLVTLSACETGVSAVAPGDELIGLARGFFAAGAPSLLMSLWMVDDDATANLMQRFYRELITTGVPSHALRTAQLSVLHEFPHPFFWAAFALVGRW